MQGKIYPGPKITKGKDITNDSEQDGFPLKSTGLAKDRFGGGLYFDIEGGKDGFNQTTQNKINKIYKNGVPSTSNFVSIDHQMSTDKGPHGYSEDETINQKTLDDNNIKNDLHPPNVFDKPTYLPNPETAPGDLQKIEQHFSSTTDNTSTTNDRIVNPKDFNLTPGNLTTNAGKQKYRTKDTIRKLFNEELYDWY